LNGEEKLFFLHVSSASVVWWLTADQTVIFITWGRIFPLSHHKCDCRWNTEWFENAL